MATALGNIAISNTAVGSSAATALALGNVVIWQGGEEPVPTVEPLCFTAEQANSTVHLDKNGSPNAISLETSTDGSTWTDYSWTDATGDTLTLANVGDKVYFRAKTENQTIGSSNSNYYKFVMSGQIAASGNIQTLLKADGSRTDVPSYCYQYMFYNCSSLTTAPALPATTLADYCYSFMFNGCTSLTTAPVLPATALASSCYYYMFRGCTALTQAPSLPATTLANNCYGSMFNGCTSLTTAPALPATTLAYGCYSYMFYNCTSLTTAPVLPATTLADFCYSYMFQNCSSLTTAPALLATTLANGCCNNMFNGCTALTQAPSLPATTLANNCYGAMFYNCSSLTTAPALPATTLASNCYNSMFRGCTKLASIDVSFSAWDSTSATSVWLYQVAATGTFKCPAALGDDSTITRGVNNCPNNWTVVNT